MKRLNNLYEKICDLDNLILADLKARKGKKNTYGVRIHDKNRQENLLNLQKMLLDGTYKTSQYKTFVIHDPKERVIYKLPYFPDRIVHHAIMNVLEPIFVSIFTADTCSCIKNRGISEARRRCKRYLKDRVNTEWCLKIDIHKFYPSIDHDCLKEIVRRKIKDKRLLDLLDEIIDSTDGLPIGNYLSQYLSNLYLAYMDHWIKEVLHVKHYVRYADDMVFFGSTKEELAIVLDKIKIYLKNLKLELKGNEQIFRIADNSNSLQGARGLDFVGFVFYHNQISIRKNIKKSFSRKCAYLNKKPQITDKKYKMSVSSWYGWAKYSNSRNLIHKITKNNDSKIFGRT